jgi:hypothetical protein
VEIRTIPSTKEIHMAATTSARAGDRAHRAGAPARRLSTETKAAFKTTEFFAYVVVLAGVLIAGAIVDQGDAGGLGARQAWLYATILTVGYLISRGLAKSGSRDPYWDESGDDHGHDGR